MEIFKQQRSVFSKGLNVDLDPNIIDPEQYIDAANVTLVPSGRFLALQNIAGTTNVQSLGIAGANILGVFATRYTIGANANLPCLTIFTAVPGGNIDIWCYDPSNSGGFTLYKLYETSTPSDYFTAGQGIVDGVLYPEKGLDILYFTDNYFEIRKIRCNIQAPNIASNSPFLTDTSMAIARRKAIGQINFTSTSTGGTLLTGTYQLAYQLINLNSTQVGGYNKYTRFSLLTSPIHVYYSPAVASGTRYAGIGMISDQQINFSITPTDDELANYTHFRVAIVENVAPEGSIALTAAVTEIQPISTYLSGNVISGFPIKNNYQNNTVTVDEIVIDTAAVDHLKTLNIKNNRLFGGNVTYKNLTYNNGTPSVTSGSIINQQHPSLLKESFSDPDFATKYLGHFREEVYRYAIAYFDKYGNFSSPLALDMSAVTGNQSNGGLTSANNAFTNPTFASGLTGWSQVNPAAFTGTPQAWTAGASYATVSLTNTNPNSKIIYQAAPLNLGGYLVQCNYNITVAIGPASLILTFMDAGLATLGTQTLYTGSSVTSGSISTLVAVPANTAYVGFSYAGGGGFSNGVIQLSATFLGTALFDMKFPARSQKIGGTTFSLFGTGGSLQSLGLQLNGIDHHPTWAQGFIILRVPRKKNILFQTPLVPMCNVYGLGPVDNFPIIAQEGVTPANVIYTSGTSTANSTGLQATPAGPINVLYPMNLAWPKKRSIVKIVADSAGGLGLNGYRAGEAQLVNDPPLTHAQIFPPGLLYTQNHPYVFSPSHQLETVDAVNLTITNLTTFGTNSNGATSWNNGSGDTSCSLTFTGLVDTDYYYDSANSGAKAALRANNNTFAAYAPFANGSPGTVLNGKFVNTPDNLEIKGVTFGWKPLIQKSAVIELATSVTAINDTNGLTFAGGSPVAKVTNPFTDFGTGGQKINTMEIANIIAGLTDARYGKATALNNYIFTGVQYNFTTAELVTVAAGGSLPKNVTVFGGDCFVTTFNFKVTDTVYSVVNQEKYLSTPVGITSTVAIAKWGRDWLNIIGPAVISTPVALRNASQYLTVILESEYNGAATDFDTADVGVSLSVKIYSALTEHKARSPLVYAYNYNLNKQNDQRIFVPIDPLNPVLTTLKSRIVYSNTKVYNTPTDGFDSIPVLNFYDLPETYGGLTKLAIAANDMYGIQQRGISYLPIGQRVIETSDAANLQVNSGDVINMPFWVDIKRGSQHLRSVKEAGDTIYMLDNENQAIYSLKDKSLSHISDKGLMSSARTLLSNLAADNAYITTHDILRNELWFSKTDGSFCYVWNDNIDCWVANYSFTSNNLQGGVFLKNNLYLVGQGIDNNLDSIHTMYTGPAAYLMGAYATPYVKFVVNPLPEFGKTFDDILLNSTDRINGITMTVEREAALGNQTTSVSLVVAQREGNYRAKVLRDAAGARMRGGKATILANWNSGVSFPTPITVASFVTQWRPSYKIY